jgi:hypothetical protein
VILVAEDQVEFIFVAGAFTPCFGALLAGRFCFVTLRNVVNIFYLRVVESSSLIDLP